MRYPVYDVIFQIIRGNAFLAHDLSLDGNACLMNGIHVSRYQRVPRRKVFTFRYQAVGTGVRKHFTEFMDIFRRQHQALCIERYPLIVGSAPAGRRVQEPAGNVCIDQLIDVFEQDFPQAAPAASVAQAFPLGALHFPQGDLFPELAGAFFHGIVSYQKLPFIVQAD